MKIKKISIIDLSLTVIAGLLLSACGAAAATNVGAQVLPTVISGSSLTSEGHLVPRDFRYLSFGMGGKVAEILVQKGEQVSAGQVLARLGNREQSQAALAGAQLELAAAQQAYADLQRTPQLAHSTAWLALLDAKNGVITANRAWDNVISTAFQTGLDNAAKDIAAKNDALAVAQAAFDKNKNLLVDDPAYISARDNLDAAQQAYNEAVRQRDTFLNQRDQAQAGLLKAQQALAEAQRQFDITQNGPNPDQLALAQARLDNAKAQVAAAQAALDSLDLKAPFDGTVVDINVVAGDLASPSNWAVLVADFSQWYVDTKDLTELDVVKVSVGQPVTVVPDALPNTKLTGKVTEIGNTFQVVNGDIAYNVRVLLEGVSPTVQPAPNLRWGMTVQLTFGP